MKNQGLGGVFATLIVASVANAQGDVVSFHAHVNNDAAIAQVPPGGFILTDVITGAASNIELRQDDNGNRVVKSAMALAPGELARYRMQSGVPFDGGTTIRFFHGDAGARDITICGYVPCANQCTPVAVPTVGEWGLVIMAILLALAASILFAQRRTSSVTV